MSDRQRSKSELLDDLESIRSLLDKDRAERAPADADEGQESDRDEQVPMLDDVVAGGLSLDEAPLSRGAVLDATDSPLDDDVFAALLSDAWKTSTADLLERSRSDIEKHRARWTPERTDALNEALKVRIDDTLRDWLLSLIRHNIDDLRQQLLNAIDDQLRTEMTKALDSQHTDSPDPDQDQQYGK